ncbi:MAG: thiol-activated cytolysin family protein [Motiliproteus sp.]
MYKNLFMLFVLLAHISMVQAVPEKEDVDNYLNNLSQWEKETLGPGKTVTEYRVIPGTNDQTSSAGPSTLAWQIKYQQDQISNAMELIKWKGATKQTVWPGAIYTGESVNKGSPALLRVGRSKMKLTIDAVIDTVSTEINEPTMASVSTAINDVFLKKLEFVNVSTTVNHTANVSHSVNEALVNVGASAKFPVYEGITAAAEAAVKASATSDTKIIAGSFDQVLFKITFDDDEIINNADLFADGTKISQIKSANPGHYSPVYVSEVHYGRSLSFLLVYKGEASESEVKAAMEASAATAGGSVEIEEKYKNILDSSTITVAAIGPFNAKGYEQAIKGGTVGELFEAVDPKTAAPLAFKLKYLNNTRDPAVVVSKYLKVPEDIMQYAKKPVGHKLTFNLKKIRPTAGNCNLPRWYYSSVYRYDNWSTVHTGEHNILNKSSKLQGAYKVNKKVSMNFQEPIDSNNPHAVLLYSGYWERGFALPAYLSGTSGAGQIAALSKLIYDYKNVQYLVYPFSNDLRPGSKLKKEQLTYGINSVTHSSNKANCPAEWTYTIIKQAEFQDGSLYP